MPSLARLAALGVIAVMNLLVQISYRFFDVFMAVKNTLAKFRPGQALT
jgi:hypothetical protein